MRYYLKGSGRIVNWVTLDVSPCYPGITSSIDIIIVVKLGTIKTLQIQQWRNKSQENGASTGRRKRQEQETEEDARTVQNAHQKRFHG